MIQRVLAIIVLLVLGGRPALAQEEVLWVQIEAQPSLESARDRAQIYATDLPDVNGFELGAGWFAIALGPYLRNDAEQVLRVYRSEGLIPADSFIAFPRSYGEQYWPLSASTLPVPEEPIAEPDPIKEPEPQPIAVEEAQADTPAPTEEVEIVLPEPEPDETPREARQSESLLSRKEREDLQIALKWAGVYEAGIDGAFGRGTRQAMEEWQFANGFETTGILTTRQRAELLRQYNAVLEGLGLEVAYDDKAGLAIMMPTAVVGFDKYEYPFAHYTAKGDIPAAILLISQQGDKQDLFGLYDIMQTLDIVPEQGPRRRDNNSFFLIGEGADFVSHTEARLDQGEIKGFTLIWPAGDEERRTRLLAEMQKSLTRLPGTLNPEQVTGEQHIDLIAGLEIRKPRLSQSGFYVDTRGTVVTTSKVVQGCSKITLDHDTEAEVLSDDATSGIAVLRARNDIFPAGSALFQTRAPRLQSDVAVSGYSYAGALGSPTLSHGTMADVRGLQGELYLNRLALNALPGDAGGPVLDTGGAVLGMLLPRDEASSRKLPTDVSFAVKSDMIQNKLADLGLTPNTTDDVADLAPEHLVDTATDMTVLVGCWD